MWADPIPRMQAPVRSTRFRPGSQAQTRPQQIDRALAQDLVDRFVAAGAAKVFIGPHTGLAGPPAIVEELPSYHDNHMHVRLAGDGVRAVSIGESTHGQPIRAFVLGRGRARLLVVGCIHGDECAGAVVATRLLHTRAPEHGSLWVIPDLNPDGHALKQRENARGVDLNRNFPSTWRRLGPPQMMSLPPFPTIVSLPPRPAITSWSGVPLIASSPSVPAIVAARVMQIGVLSPREPSTAAASANSGTRSSSNCRLTDLRRLSLERPPDDTPSTHTP
jgi:hypothetical protein